VAGVVKDAIGRPLPGVSLVLQTNDGHIVSQGTTDSGGQFNFKQVPPGNYMIVANKAGFGTATAAIAAARMSVPITVTMEADQALSLPVITSRLDVARNRLDTKTGVSEYHFTQKAIEDLPGGSNTRFDQVILQAPGVAQDSFGQIHVRNEHGNIQYRIDGVQLPEGVSFFSQTESARFARSIDLLSGALPAQYGFRTTGVIDIKTKTGTLEDGGSIGFYGGQRYTYQPSFEFGGHRGHYSYFLTGQFLANDRGLEPPTRAPTALHDHTDQGNFFAYLSDVLTPSTRISLISGSSLARFGIPSNPNQMPAFTLAGVNDVDPMAFPSSNVQEKQIEQNYYNVLSLQQVLSPKLSYQLSAFSRYSVFRFVPDLFGDLIYTGVAGAIFRSSFVNGLQGDGSYQLAEKHTLRTGFYFSGERDEIDNHSIVFPTDNNGNQASDVPFPIVDDTAVTAWHYDAYLQDEWHPFEPLTINFGARFDISDDFKRTNQLSPRIGAVYLPWRGTTLHAGYARYFTPIPVEVAQVRSLSKFQNTTNAPANFIDPRPSPERAHYFDVGAIQEIVPGLTVGADSYFKYSKDLIDEGQFGSALLFVPFNYSHGRQYGVETTVNFIRGNFSAYLNEAFSRGQGKRISSGQFNFGQDELDFIATHWINLDHDQTITGSGGIIYRWNKFTFSFDGFHGSGLRTGFANTGNLPTYFQFNAGIARLFSWYRPDDLEARVDVVNLFDHSYVIRNGSGIGVGAPQFGPRLTVYGGIKWNFSLAKVPVPLPAPNAPVQSQGVAP